MAEKAKHPKNLCALADLSWQENITFVTSTCNLSLIEQYEFQPDKSIFKKNNE